MIILKFRPVVELVLLLRLPSQSDAAGEIESSPSLLHPFDVVAEGVGLTPSTYIRLILAELLPVMELCAQNKVARAGKTLPIGHDGSVVVGWVIIGRLERAGTTRRAAIVCKLSTRIGFQFASVSNVLLVVQGRRDASVLFSTG